MTAKPHVLLTSVIRPFGGPGEGASVGAELFHAQITRAQKGFSLRQVIRVWGLDLIAQNITAPTVVLHYPSLSELKKEVQNHSYQYVGINFVVATFHKVRAMVRVIREQSPDTKIILGGYGTVLPDEVLRPFADYICREEGVTFMRKLLGEDASLPIASAHSPVPSTAVLGHQQSTVVGHVAAGLGCANGCDFCCTSHFFRRKHIRLVPDGYALYEAMMETQKRAAKEGYEMQSWAVIDEDFFLYRKRAEQFLEAVRKGGKSLSLLGFGSIKGLSQFTAEEIAEMGFDLIWTAFEGKESGYEKLQGRPISDLYADLRKQGVAVLSSMIIGFPYQDEAQIYREFAELMNLEPALCQFLIYFAFPGTPFFDQVSQEKRFLPQYKDKPDLRRWDGFSLHLSHPHFTPERLEELQRELYRQDFARLGPSLYRLARVWLTGYEHLRNSPNPLLRARAERLRAQIPSVRMSLPAAPYLLRSDAALQRAEQLREDLDRVLGKEPLLNRLVSPVVVASGLLSGFLASQGLLQQPGLLRLAHRMAEPEADSKTPSVFALQGKGKTLWSRLSEDLEQRAIRPLLHRMFENPDPAVMPIANWEDAGKGGVPKTYHGLRHPASETVGTTEG
jgi:hypothetical protein